MGDFLSERIPPLDRGQLEEGVKQASYHLLSLGVTTFQDLSARNDSERWRMFRMWQGSGLLTCRVTMALGVKALDEYRDLSISTAGPQLRLGGVKITLDETTGRLNPSPEELEQVVGRIHRAGLQAILHAVEETTIRAACSAVASASRRFPRTDHRHRVEHCSVCPPDLSGNLSSLGILVVTQPPFIYYHGDRYLRTVSEGELRYLYPIATLMKSGVQVAASSDCPLASANPMIGIFAAASRLTERGECLLPEERISPLEALRMYTVYAAQSSFEENSKGSIAPGKLADLVVWDEDPTKVTVEEIKDLHAEMTILGGKVAWRRG
jgi:hypothetical protein